MTVLVSVTTLYRYVPKNPYDCVHAEFLEEIRMSYHNLVHSSH